MTDAGPVEVYVVPGSLFCIKVLAALHYKRVPYRKLTLNPLALRRELPPPHQVPVLRLSDGSLVPDSRAILSHVDSRYSAAACPLYPPVRAGVAAARQWESVGALEQFAHDVLSPLHNYFSAVPERGQRDVSRPYVSSLLPGAVNKLLPFIPALGVRAVRRSMLERVTPVLGADVVACEAAAEKKLVEALQQVEDAFTEPGQKFLFDTDGPTAADFAVFAPLKRLLSEFPDVAGGMGAALPDVLEKAGGLPKVKAYFDRMDAAYYKGKIDWSKDDA